MDESRAASLSSLGLHLDSVEAELLNKRFAGTSAGYVNYVAFACAVDEAERIFSTREPRSWVAQVRRTHAPVSSL